VRGVEKEAALVGHSRNFVGGHHRGQRQSGAKRFREGEPPHGAAHLGDDAVEPGGRRQGLTAALCSPISAPR